MRNSSGRNAEPGKHKDLNDDPDDQNADCEKYVVHAIQSFFSGFSAFSDFSALAALPLGFLICS